MSLALAAKLSVAAAFTLHAAPDASFNVGGWDVESTSRSLPLAVGNAVNIGTFYFSGPGAGTLRITVNVNAASYSVSKQYMLPMRWGGLPVNTWLNVLPSNSTGAYSNNDFELDVLGANATQASLRLRTTSSDGTHVGVADIVIESTGISSIGFSGATAAAAIPTGYFPGNVLVQQRGNVGIATLPSSDAVLDLNGGDTKGLRLRPRSVAGAPTTGTWSVGTMILDSNATLYVCTTSGTPGTWKKVGL